MQNRGNEVFRNHGLLFQQVEQGKLAANGFELGPAVGAGFEVSGNSCGFLLVKQAEAVFAELVGIEMHYRTPPFGSSVDSFLRARDMCVLTVPSEQSMISATSA